MIPKVLCVKNEDVYFLNRDCNEVYRLQGQQCQFIGAINMPRQFDRCETMIVTEDEIFLMPYVGNDIININNKEEMMNYSLGNGEVKRIVRSVTYGNKIYMFQYQGGEIVCFDTERKEVTYINVPDYLVSESNNCKIYGDICVWNEHELVIPLQGSNILLLFDMESGNIGYKSFEKEIQIATLAIADDVWYIVDVNGENLYEYYCTADVLKKYQIEIKKSFKQEIGVNPFKEVYQRCVYYNGYLWLLPFAFSNMILKVDVKTKSVHTIVEFENMFCVWDYAVNKDCLYIATNEGLCVIDMNTNQWEIIKSIYMERQSRIKHMLYKMQCDGCVNESEFGIEVLFDYMDTLALKADM